MANVGVSKSCQPIRPIFGDVVVLATSGLFPFGVGRIVKVIHISK